MIKRFCLFCGEEFLVYSSKIEEGKGKYCSKVCFQDDHKKIKRICKYCGDEFSVYLAVAKKNQGIFCSRRCSSNSRCGVRKVENNCKCECCGEGFYVKRFLA